MRVRDELSGQEYEAPEVLWILGSNSGHTSRHVRITAAKARAWAVSWTIPGVKAWAPSASDAAVWVPVEVLA